MNQQQTDKRWQDLELHIHQMVGRFLKGDVPAIEHKPRHVALLQMPAEDSRKESAKAAS